MHKDGCQLLGCFCGPRMNADSIGIQSPTTYSPFLLFVLCTAGAKEKKKHACASVFFRCCQNNALEAPPKTCLEMLGYCVKKADNSCIKYRHPNASMPLCT
jgi:hypothetical protein